MTPTIRPIFILLIAVLCVVTAFVPSVVAQQTQLLTGYSLYAERDTLILVPDSTHYTLDISTIVWGSEVITIGIDSLVREMDYSIDYLGKTLTLAVPPTDTVTAIIAYRSSPFSDPVSVRIWEGPILWNDSLSLTPSNRSNRNPATQSMGGGSAPSPYQTTDAIRTSGSLVRGVRIGSNEGLALDSGLRLNLDGEIADGVSITASMTDRLTPIQPEGNTQTLKEIDKVFVDLSSENAGVTLGDVDLDFSGTSFADYHRKVKGAKGRWSGESASANLAGAVTQAKFRTYSFLGVEGNQGPYLLTGDNISANVFVIAGSEKVYLDGKLLTRGETNDYVIDYSTAELTFTPYRQITSDSRLVVDYEYSDRTYNRSIVAAQVTSAIAAGKLNVSGRFLREADDKNNPVGANFSESEIGVLGVTMLGEPSVEGGRYVGVGNGAYIKTPDPEGSDSVYSYVGQNPDRTFIGDWSVTFTRVDEGEGDYHNRIGDSLFVSIFGNSFIDYVGQGNGSFIAVKFLKTPSTHSLADFSFETNFSERFHLKSEVATSALNENTFRENDSSGKTGTAFRIGGDWSSSPADSSNALKIDFNVRSVGGSFENIDRITEAEYDRRWNLPAEISTSELSGETGVTYNMGGGQTVYSRVGRLRIEDERTSDRLELGAIHDFKFVGRASYNREDISTDITGDSSTSDWLRQRGELFNSFGIFRPIIGFEREDRRDVDSLTAGFEFDEYYAGFALSKLGPVDINVERRQRDDSQYSGGILMPRSNAVTSTISMNITKWRSLSTQLRLSRRNRRYKGEFAGSHPSVKTNLVDLHSDYRPMKGAVKLETDYRAAAERIATRERVYLKVSEGAGQFRYDEEIGEYVPDAVGDYILITRQTRDYEPVVDIGTSVRLTIDPARATKSRRSRRSRDTGFWRSFSSKTLVRIDEKSREPDTDAIYFLDMSKFRNRETTVFGRFDFSEDMTLFKRRNGSSLRFRYRYLDEMNNRFVSGGENSLLREALVRWRKTVSEKTRLEIEVGRSLTQRQFDAATRRDREVASDEYNFDLSHLPLTKVELGLKVTWSNDDDRSFVNGLTARLADIGLRSTFFLKGAGQLRLKLSRADVAVTPSGTPITYEMAKGFKEGGTYKWSVGFDYRLSGNLNAMLNYEGTNEPFRDTRHLGRAEVRAWF